MGDYYKGRVIQVVPEAERLTWRKSEPKTGNDLKFSSISEVNASLDTNRFQFCLPTVGPEPYLVDNKTFLVKTDEYFILNPYQQVRAEGIFKKKVEGFCIFIDRQTMASVASRLDSPLETALDSPFDLPWQQQEFVIKNYRLLENSFGRYLSRLKEILCTDAPQHVMDWNAFYYGIAENFLMAHRKIGKQLEAISSTRMPTKQEIFKRLSLAHSYLLENFDQPLSLDKLARVALCSKYHLVRLYRQVYGLTPYQHLLQLRVKKAKELLLQDYSPTEIAYRLSFSDRRAFAKVFKRFTGVAPSKFQLGNRFGPA